MASATRIAFAGIDLIKTRPRAVLAWGFVYLLFAVVMSLLTRPLVEQMMLAMPRPGSPLPPVAFEWNLFGPILVANLGIYGMLLVLLAAAMRAVLKPAEQGGAFFIRVGLDELRLLGTIIVIGLMLLGVYIVSIIGLGILGTIGAVAVGAIGGGGSDGVHPALFLFVLALVLLEFALLLAFQVRFALALPLTILRGRIVIREAWRRSKGHFWALFGAFLLNGLVVAAVSLLVAVPVLLSYFADGGMAAALSDPQRQIRAMQSPLLYPLWLFMPLIGGFTVSMLGGALGMAVLETEPTAG